MATRKFFTETTIPRRKLSKCCKELDQQDRISQLPDEVIVSILSCLSLKEAAATSSLSSRWMHLWKLLPRLTFDATVELLIRSPDKKKEKHDKFVKWVNQVLLSHKCSALEEFRVSCDLTLAYQKAIDDWLEFVLARKVQKLELNFATFVRHYRDYRDCYAIPFEVVTKTSSLPNKLISGGMHPCTFGCSESLKELALWSVNVSGEVIQHLLSNCPRLERLEVVGSGHLVDLQVSGPSLNLRYLKIVYCYNMKLLKICDTNLVSAECWGVRNCVQFNDNNPLLVEVSLSSANLVHAFSPKPSNFLSHLESLRVHVGSPWGNLVIHKSPGLPSLKQLAVRVAVMNNKSLYRFYSLVEEAPCLQKFVMEMVRFPGYKRDYTRVEEPPYRPHCQLKRVELKGYTGTRNSLEIVIYFVKNAIHLEELVIDPISRPALCDRDEQLEQEEVARKLAKQQMEEISRSAPHLKISIL